MDVRDAPAGGTIEAVTATDMPAPRLPLLVEPWPAAGPKGHPFRPCPVCGEPWRPWAFSRLPCHAACLYDAAATHEIRELHQSSRYSRRQGDLAAALGISTSVLRAVLA